MKMENNSAFVTHADISELTTQISNLVVEMKNDRENRKDSDTRHKDEIANLWLKVNKLEESIVDIKTRLPTLEEMKENQSKIRNSVITALAIAAIIGGLTMKFAGT